jgi:phage shock protein A
MPDEPEAQVEPLAEPAIDPDYTAGGVPTFESVREKIQTRYGTAVGAAELDAQTREGRTIEEQYDARQRAAAERLEQIRESMRGPATSDAEQHDNA